MSFEIDEQNISGGIDDHIYEMAEGKPRYLIEAIETMSRKDRLELAFQLGNHWEDSDIPDGWVWWPIPIRGESEESRVEHLRVWSTCECFASDCASIARHVDSCTDLTSPIEIWLDTSGYVTVDIHSGTHKDER